MASPSPEHKSQKCINTQPILSQQNLNRIGIPPQFPKHHFINNILVGPHFWANHMHTSKCLSVNGHGHIYCLAYHKYFCPECSSPRRSMMSPSCPICENKDEYEKYNAANFKLKLCGNIWYYQEFYDGHAHDKSCVLSSSDGSFYCTKTCFDIKNKCKNCKIPCFLNIYCTKCMTEDHI